MNKNKLYENIMKDVSKIVKKHLNELSSNTYAAAAEKQKLMLDDDDYIIAHDDEYLLKAHNRISRFQDAATKARFSERRNEILQQRKSKDLDGIWNQFIDDTTSDKKFIKYNENIISVFLDAFTESYIYNGYGDFTLELVDWEIDYIEDDDWHTLANKCYRLFRKYIKANNISIEKNESNVSTFYHMGRYYKSWLSTWIKPLLINAIQILEPYNVSSGNMPIKKLPIGFKIDKQVFDYKYVVICTYLDHLKSFGEVTGIRYIYNLGSECDAPFLMWSNDKKLLEKQINMIENDIYYSNKSNGGDIELYDTKDLSVELLREIIKEYPFGSYTIEW